MTLTARTLTPLQRRRLSWRIAKGMTLPEAAAPAGLNGDEAGRLLDDGHFPLLVEAYRALEALPEHARRRRLLQLAIRVIEQAALTGDMRIALFVMRQEALGRDAAEVLADGVIRALERREPQCRPPDNTSPTMQLPPEPRAPSCPADNAIYRAAASLRSDVMDEFEMQSAIAMAGPGSFDREASQRSGDERLQQAAPANIPERAEAEDMPPGYPADDEKPHEPHAAAPPDPVPQVSAYRLNERQLQYLADLGIARSLATGPPAGDGPDDPNEPTTS